MTREEKADCMARTEKGEKRKGEGGRVECLV